VSAKPKSILTTVWLVRPDILIMPNGRGSYVAVSYAQYRRAGLGPMAIGEIWKVRIEIRDEEKRT